jgi:hypothetical protein
MAATTTHPGYKEPLKRERDLDPAYIHQRTAARYSMDAVKLRYQEHFEMLDQLWSGGWLADKPERRRFGWLA